MNNYDNIAYSIKQLGRKNILIGDQTITDIPQNTYYIAVKEMWSIYTDMGRSKTIYYNKWMWICLVCFP